MRLAALPLSSLYYTWPRPHRRTESAAALANLAAGNATNKETIREAGAMPLIALLQAGNTAEVAQHAAALANLSGIAPFFALLHPRPLLARPR